MAESKTLEREYVIPLRREWMKVARYKRTRRAVQEIKKFIARHMKVEDRDLSKVKLDVYLNNEIWFRGCKNPPAKVSVKAKKVDGIVEVTFVEEPDIVKFARAKHAKMHKAVEKKKVAEKKGDKAEDTAKKDEQTPEEKKTESEKEKSVEEANVKIAEQSAKAVKHTTSAKDAPQIQRKALKK